MQTEFGVIVTMKEQIMYNILKELKKSNELLQSLIDKQDVVIVKESELPIEPEPEEKVSKRKKKSDPEKASEENTSVEGEDNPKRG